MYKTAVPLVRFYENFEENIKQAEKLGASRIWMCPCRATADEKTRELNIERIKQSRLIYEKAGFETGVWISTLGHGGDLIGLSSDHNDGYTHITGLNGVTTSDSYCPLDPSFSSAVCDYLKELASTGVKMIMLDDDFRFSHRADCGCTCKYHLAEYSKRLGENIKREDIIKKAFGGGYNKYRKAYYDMLGDTLRNFSQAMRNAIDEVDDTIRFGFCAVTSSWDCDGTDAIELSRIMAGKNRPFIRLIGAPYWSANGGVTGHVQYVAELERMQLEWCRNEDIEIYTEGDTYPRPRFRVPANYLECFDTILRADAKADGILKYGIDYNSVPDYETGYADKTYKNRELYKKIEEHFRDKRAVGINVTCEMKKLLHTDFSLFGRKTGNTWDDAFYQSEQLLLTNCSVPSTYEDAPVTVAFGENAKYIKNTVKGIITDAVGAYFLAEKGIDTGVKVSTEKVRYNVTSEHFYAENDDVTTEHCNLSFVPSEEAEILSVFNCENDIKIPSAIKYENAEGIRFLIYNYDFDGVKNNTAFMRNYYRVSQLIREYEWLSGERLPAICQRHPDLYIMAKKNEKSMAVGLWNIFPDEIDNAVIELDKVHANIEFINCDGELKGNKVVLKSTVQPYSFAGFEVC